MTQIFASPTVQRWRCLPQYLAWLCLGAVLAGCGGGSEDAEPQSPAAPGPTVPTNPPGPVAPGGVTYGDLRAAALGVGAVLFAAMAWRWPLAHRSAAR